VTGAPFPPFFHGPKIPSTPSPLSWFLCAPVRSKFLCFVATALPNDAFPRCFGHPKRSIPFSPMEVWEDTNKPARRQAPVNCRRTDPFVAFPFISPFSGRRGRSKIERIQRLRSPPEWSVFFLNEESPRRSPSSSPPLENPGSPPPLTRPRPKGITGL